MSVLLVPFLTVCLVLLLPFVLLVCPVSVWTKLVLPVPLVLKVVLPVLPTVKDPVLLVWVPEELLQTVLVLDLPQFGTLPI